MTKGTPASSQIVFLEQRVAVLEDDNERLRAEVKTWVGHAKTAIWSDSEECKMLTAEVERLRVALHPFADAAGKFDPDEGDGSQHVWGWSPTIGMLRKARAALEGK